MIHENIELTGSFVVSGSFVLPNHPNTGSVSALTGSVYHDTTDNILKVYTGNAWVTVGEQTASAAGGAANTNIEYLVIAGGGGGSSYGGGGAGGYLSSSIDSVTSGSTYTVTVGGGGAGSGNSYTGVGAAGSNSTIAGSTISTITAVGGGYGGNNDPTPASDGGSGGGGSDGPTDASGGSGTVGQGNDGGAGSYSDPHYMGGGGGGAGAVGGAGVATGTRTGGAGGAGLASKITGKGRFRAGGGGGVRYNTTGTIGAGGAGGGGNGGTWNGSTSAISSATAGTANSGSGGGAGQNGGKGVVILAYPTGSATGQGGVKTTRSDGQFVHTFNESGTFTLGGSDFHTIAPSEHFDIALKTYGTSGNTTVDGLRFQPDFVWDATRNQNYYHRLSDSVRGVQKSLRNTTTDAESDDHFSVQSFTSDGFTTKNYSTGDNHVNWCWKAGGTASSNSDGTITSNVSANTKAGFSIVTYTGTLSSATTSTGASVGHGLDSAPELIMFFNRGGATNRVVSVAGDNWSDMATLTGNTVTDYNATYPQAAPTDSVFYTNYVSAINVSAANHVAYCWHSVPGFSKIGTYTGQSSGDLTVTTGFRPIFVAVKAWSASGHWEIHDARRYSSLYEDTGLSKRLRWTESSSEGTFNDSPINFTSTGFVLDSSVSANNYVDYDKNGVTYLYFAISE